MQQAVLSFDPELFIFSGLQSYISVKLTANSLMKNIRQKAVTGEIRLSLVNRGRVWWLQ